MRWVEVVEVVAVVVPDAVAVVGRGVWVAPTPLARAATAPARDAGTKNRM